MTYSIFSDKGGIRCEQVAVVAECAGREDGLESGVVPSHQSKTPARSDGPDNRARAERLLETKTGLWGIYWDILLWI